MHRQSTFWLWFGVFVAVTLYFVAAPNLTGVNWQWLQGIAYLLSWTMAVGCAYGLGKDAIEFYDEEKIALTQANPEIMRLRLGLQTIQAVRDLDPDQTHMMQSARALIKVLGGIEGPRYMLDAGEYQIDMEFVNFYLDLAEGPTLKPQRYWGEGERWQKNGELMRVLVKQVQDYLAMRGLATPVMGNQNPEVYSWPQLNRHLYGKASE